MGKNQLMKLVVAGTLAATILMPIAATGYNVVEGSRASAAAYVYSDNPYVKTIYNFKNSTDTSVKVDWEITGVEESELDQLEYRIVMDGNELGRVPHRDGLWERQSFVIDGLEPSTSYTVFVQAYKNGELLAENYMPKETLPTPTYFEDAALEAAVKSNLGVKGALTLEDVKSLDYLDAFEYRIQSLKGLELATKIDALFLGSNDITDLSVLNHLPNIELLMLSEMNISDISVLANLTKLEGLILSGTNVSDISPLSNLVHLNDVDLEGNKIKDITPLKGLTNITSLDLNNNNIKNIEPLLSLTNLSTVYLNGNPLTAEANSVIHELFSRSVLVYHDELVEESYTWVKKDGSWYYVDQHNKNVTGWVKDKGTWYYLKSNGAMIENDWVKDGSKWYYLGKGGAMQTNSWVKDGAWYYVDSNGVMLENKWLKDAGKWYYLGKGGVMLTNSWLNDGAWYYLLKDGQMATGWKTISNKWYYFYSNGKMASNTTINGYKLSKSGAWD